MVALVLTHLPTGGTDGSAAPSSDRPATAAASGTGSLGSEFAAPVATSTAAQPCGRSRKPPRWDHVVWIWLENHSYNQTLGPLGSAAQRKMPYFNLLARTCGLATDYHAITHPSLPNYLHAVSGRSSATKTCAPRSCSQRQVSLFTLLNRARKSWRVYSESMPTVCSATDQGRYRVKHNPAPYFPGLGRTCRVGNQPLGTPTRGNFSTALARNRVAAFNFVVPNMCNSTHDCPLATGDRWLRGWMPRILGSRAYRTGRTAIFISWDEGAGGRERMACSTSRDASCHVATVIVSPSTGRGARSRVSYSHWSLLRTTQEMLRVGPLLGNAVRAYSMRRPFGL